MVAIALPAIGVLGRGFGCLVAVFARVEDGLIASKGMSIPAAGTVDLNWYPFPFVDVLIGLAG